MKPWSHGMLGRLLVSGSGWKPSMKATESLLKAFSKSPNRVLTHSHMIPQPPRSSRGSFAEVVLSCTCGVWISLLVLIRKEGVFFQIVSCFFKCNYIVFFFHTFWRHKPELGKNQLILRFLLVQVGPGLWLYLTLIPGIMLPALVLIYCMILPRYREKRLELRWQESA